jgi:hypothetical protein
MADAAIPDVVDLLGSGSLESPRNLPAFQGMRGVIVAGRRTWSRIGIVLFLSGLSASGCGATLYTVNIAPASRMVEQAGEANADEHAPYEYYYAAEHLRKAREEAAEASYQDAMRFAAVAEEYGLKARDLARRRMREMGR